MTILWGAFTAGLDAGLVYSDTFPKMGETWIPAEVTKGQSLAKALLETHAGVQFLHRWLAILSAMSILLYAFCAISARKRREKAFAALGVMIVLQVALGLSTLFSGVALLPAVLHQAGAIVVLTLLLMILHGLKPQAVPQHG